MPAQTSRRGMAVLLASLGEWFPVRHPRTASANRRAARMRTVTQIELWGGVERTVARVGGRIIDQIRRTGHEERADDLNRFAALGLRRLRYPVLWERVAPNGLDRADWTWSDERLGHLRELGIAPIVGLVHHGSGPLAAGLLDDGFAAGLAAYAEE